MSAFNFGSTIAADLYVDGRMVPDDEVRVVIFCPSWHTVGRVTKDELFLGQQPVALSAGDDVPVQTRCAQVHCPTREFYLISMSKLRQAMKKRRRGKQRIPLQDIGEELPPILDV